MYEPRRNAKLRLLVDYFRHTPDPDRGYALAAMTDALMFKEAKPNLIRGLVEERVDPVLFRMSYHYVGDLAETVALIWPAPADPTSPSPAAASEAAGAGGPAGAPGEASPALPRRAAPGGATPAAAGAVAGPGHNRPPPHVPSIAEVIETRATT